MAGFFILLFCRRVATKAYLLTKQHIERRFKDVLLVQSRQKMSRQYCISFMLRFGC